MAKQPKQRGSAKKEEDVYEVEAILSHRKVSISGHSNVITDRYCSLLWFIHIVSMCDYIPRLTDTCCRDWGWRGGYVPYCHMQYASSITCSVDKLVHDMTYWYLLYWSGAHETARCVAWNYLKYSEIPLTRTPLGHSLSGWIIEVHDMTLYLLLILILINVHYNNS